MMEMPPLPEPFAVHELWGQNVNVYSAAQVRALCESCARMAREEAAKLCDAQVEMYGTKMAQAMEHGMEERWDRFHAYAEAVEYIAAVIRQQVRQRCLSAAPALATLVDGITPENRHGDAWRSKDGEMTTNKALQAALKRMLDAFHEDPFEADTMGAVEQAYEALALPEDAPDLMVAAKCAANVLALLEPELARMGCGAARVPEMLRAAIDASAPSV